MHIRRLSPSVALVAAFLTLGLGPSRGADAGFIGELTLNLEGSVFTGAGPGPNPIVLSLDLTASSNGWEKIWAAAPGYNRADHPGLVASAEITSTRARLSLTVKIVPTEGLTGGLGRYEIDLTRTGQNLVGTWKGDFKGRALTGRAWGEIHPPRGAPAADFRPPLLVDHPRVLFRKSDLPALKQKLNTWPGNDALAKIKSATDDPVALGVLYQLTGDRAPAETAWRLVQGMMTTGGPGPAGTGHVWGDRLRAIGLAYDLCYDAWDEGAKTLVTQYLLSSLRIVFQTPEVLTAGVPINPTPGSTFHNMVVGGASIATLALWGQRGDPPPKPGAGGGLVTLNANDFTPRPGVPIIPLVTNALLTRWLVAGPFVSAGPAPSELDNVVRPEPFSAESIEEGSRVSLSAQERPFQTLGTNFIFQSILTGDLPVLRLPPGPPDSVSYFFGVVENDQPRRVRLEVRHINAVIWIQGQQIREAQSIQLGRGRFPVLIEVRAKLNVPNWIEPRWIPVTGPSPAESVVTPADYAFDLKLWHADEDAWQRAKQMDARILDWFRLGEVRMKRGYRAMMGDGGWQAEGEVFTLYSCRLPLEYADGYFKMFGVPPSSRPDVTSFIPRYVAGTVFGSGAPLYQGFGYSLGQSIDAGHIARAFAITPEAWKPALLWAWNELGRKPASDVPKMDIEGIEPSLDGQVSSAIFSLLNYPTHVKPENPARILPHVWAALGRGGFTFRQDWKGAEDCVAQFYARIAPPIGLHHAEAGSFQIYGLGHVWTQRGLSGRNGSRWLDNLVVLPDDEIDPDALSQISNYRADEKTGSGAVTVNLDRIYAGHRTQFDAQGSLKKLDADTGVRGLRSFAADYSGASGASALFAVADKISGGGRKVWLFQLPDGLLTSQVRLEGHTFFFTQGRASLKGTFLSAPPIELTMGTGLATVLVSDGVSENRANIERRAIQAAGTNGFFVIFTLQQGNPPEVKITGSGLNAQATVGRQTVSFDGEKIVFGKN